MAAETNWLNDLPGQNLYVGGTEVLPTKKTWNLIGADAIYNATYDRIDITLAGSGGDWLESVRTASTADFPSTRVGNTLTATAVGALTVGGVAVSAGDRILLKDQTQGAHNGIYNVDVAGDGSTAAVVTRTILTDETGEVTPGLTVYVEDGTRGGEYWGVSNVGTITLNSTVITFQNTVAGITGTGTDFHVMLWDGTSNAQDSEVTIAASGAIAWTAAATANSISSPTIAGAANDLTITAQSSSALGGGDVRIQPGSGGTTQGVFEVFSAGGTVHMRVNDTDTTVLTALNVDSLTATENYIDLDTGAGAALSAANHVRLRSNAGVFEVSEGGGAYTSPFTGLTGANGLSWTVNQDGVAGTDEDASLILEGGDGGTELLQSYLTQDSSADSLYLYTKLSTVGAGQTDRSTSVTIGPQTQFSATTVDADASLTFRGHDNGDAVGTFYDFQMVLDTSLQRMTLGSGWVNELALEYDGFRETPSAARAPVILKTHGGVLTTNATVTTAHSYTIATGKAIHFRAVVTMRSATDGDSGSQVIEGSAENTGGTAAIVGTNSVVHAAAEDGTWGTVQTTPVIVDASGADIRVRVEGGAGDNVDWNVELEIHEQQTA